MNRLKTYLLALILAIAAFLSLNTASGQTPPPPPPPNGGPNNGHGLGGNQGPGGGAPIGGGLEILIALGALYAGKKVYTFMGAKEE
jgi:hypothetical protein